tara:strand:- start:27742 stop:28017 length:276 start_codon:yes stop_codon:yes gene_type:complete
MLTSAMLENANLVCFYCTLDIHTSKIIFVCFFHRHWIILKEAAIEQIFHALYRDVLISDLLPNSPRQLVISQLKLSFNKGLNQCKHFVLLP